MTEKTIKSGPDIVKEFVRSLSEDSSLVACCRFQRHRVRCMNETGGGVWSDASSRERGIKWGQVLR